MNQSAYLVIDATGRILELLDGSGCLICDFRGCERPDLALAIANFVEALEGADDD